MMDRIYTGYSGAGIDSKILPCIRMPYLRDTTVIMGHVPEWWFHCVQAFARWTQLLFYDIKTWFCCRKKIRHTTSKLRYTLYKRQPCISNLVPILNQSLFRFRPLLQWYVVCYRYPAITKIQTDITNDKFNRVTWDSPQCHTVYAQTSFLPMIHQWYTSSCAV